MARGTRTEWAERVRRWRASGQSAREYCAGRGLQPRTLLWWSSKVGHEKPSTTAFIEVVPVAAPAAEGCIEVVVREGLRVRVSGQFDPAVLRSVVAALEAR
jgi:hypothetical protein